MPSILPLKDLLHASGIDPRYGRTLKHLLHGESISLTPRVSARNIFIGQY